MRDISEAGPGSPTSTVGTKGGTSVVLLRVDTILLWGSRLESVKYSSAPRWAPIVLREPRSIVHKSAKGLVRFLRVSLLLSRKGGLEDGAGDLQKTLRCLSQHW